MQCPNCAATLIKSVDEKKMICQYCDTEYPIHENNTNKNIDKHIRYNIKMLSCKNKVYAIKIYRELSGVDLKRAKEKIDSIPTILFENLNKETAERYSKAFIDEGAGEGIIIEESR